MFEFGTHTLDLLRIFARRMSTTRFLVSGSPTRHLLSLRCGFFDRFGLYLVAAVASHLALFAVQQVAQNARARYVCRRHLHRVHSTSLCIDPDMRLQPEVPPVADPSLVHLRIAFTTRAFGRRSYDPIRGQPPFAALRVWTF
jgi:hypothetical protein